MTETNMIAHSLDSKIRTKDVILSENVLFESLLLPENVLRGLSASGFQKPSPIQIKALPVGRCGFDLIVKSKSGTGKTLVFGLIALETIKLEQQIPQVLILVPTREIAVQIEDVLRNIGQFLEGLSVQTFIGGLPLKSDKIKCTSCHIAVGTPGRVKQLIKEGYLAINSVRLFVLDEADKLMENSFRNDITEIFNSLSNKKQVIMSSATYPNELESFLNDYMLSPTLVSVEYETPLLLGLKQFVRILKSSPNVVQQTKVKNDELLKILSTVSFTQCLIFSNYQTRAESISNFLNRNQWSCTFISAAQNQSQRLNSLSSLKNFKCRILISTDLTARGIDAFNVDLVINYDIPADAMTYLHRMGRAGRYGSTGNCINLALVGQETNLLQNILGVIGGQNLSMPILDDSLSLEKSKISSENLLFATLPDNIKEFTDKCKNEIIGMKKNTDKSKKKKDSQNISEKVVLSRDEETVRKVVEEKLADVDDVSSILGQFASGTFELNTNVDNTTINTQINDLYNELLPSPPKVSNIDKDLKANSIETADPIYILQQLTKENTFFECTEEKPDEKKRKRSLNSIDSQSDETIKKEWFQEETVCRNKALFSVAKSLSDVQTCGDDSDYLTEYLGMLKTKEKLEAEDILKKNKVNINKNNSSDTKVNRQVENYDDVVENIFLLAYKSQVMNSGKWQEHIPEEEKGKLDDNYVLEKEKDQDCDEFEEETYDDYREDNYYENEEYDEDYDFEMETEVQVNYAEEISHETTQDPNDYSFMKWIPVTSSDQNEDKQINLESKPSTSQHSMSTASSRKMETFNPPTTQVAIANDSLYYQDLYDHYYQHCSNNLWQTGLCFDTVQHFDEWYCYNWQNQVAAVRNFVQKKIYLEEMRRFQEEYNKRPTE